MWLEIERIRTQIPHLFTEVSIRVILILIVCLLQLNVKPHIHHITDSELASYMRPRRDSYVPPWLMVVIIVFVPLILLCLPCVLTGDRDDTLQALLAWTLALSINALTTETTKLIVGRPRPDYYYRCYPDGQIKIDCTGNMRDVMEGRKSFPSGHSSFSFCSMGFLSIWLCGRLQVLSWNRGDGSRVLVCLMPLVLASVVALSRYVDNHHHWEDVFVGSVMGLVSSYACYRQYYHSLDCDLAGYPYIIIQNDSYDSDILCGNRNNELDLYVKCKSDRSIEINIKNDKKYS